MQVVYNVFDQSPEDELFPCCEKHGIAVIARVPFDEGSLSGTLTPSSTWPAGDFRNLYFNPDNLQATLPRVARLEQSSRPACRCPSWRCEQPRSSRRLDGHPGDAELEHVDGTRV